MKKKLTKEQTWKKLFREKIIPAIFMILYGMLLIKMFEIGTR